MDSQEVDGKKIIVGWCENNTTSPVHVKYEAVLKLRNKGEQIRKGTTLTLPASPTLLTKAIFNLHDVEFEHLRLVVLNRKDEILAFDKIINPQPSALSEIDDKAIDPSPTIISTQRKSLAHELEIEGLILDETRSKLARDFYEIFYRNWSSIAVDSRGRTIIIKEIPGRIGIGTTIVVLMDETSVIQLNLQPRASVVEDLAGQVVTALEKYMNDPNNHSVIDGDDLTGSGIY
ncbi:MAG: CsgE family curli-type amyloid fiber assembly protein [Bacteroidota bacterium]